MPAQQGVLELIPLSEIKIKPNFNVRSKAQFKTAELKELTDNIERHGIIQPVLVQKKGDEHWLIAGHRRIASARIVARRNGGEQKYEVPAKVLEISDREAAELMMVENIQRTDLTPLEEAQGFERYLKKFPKVKDLADRCGKPAAYINRRVAVLKLPERILRAWNAGEISFGVLEQLIRVSAETAVEIFDRIGEYQKWGQVIPVRKVEQWIEQSMLCIKNAMFDTKKAGCLKCSYNSDVQKSLFASEADMLRCLNPDCFMEKQKKHLEESWPAIRKSRKLKTNGAVIHDSTVSWKSFNIFARSDKVSPVCTECGHHKTLMGLDGKVEHPRVCFGDEKCFNGAKACMANGAGKSDRKQGIRSKAEVMQAERDARRAKSVERIGVETRELHYEKAIPKKIGMLRAQDDDMLRLVLVSLVHNQPVLKKCLAEHFGIEPSCGTYYDIDSAKAVRLVRHLDIATVKCMLKDCSKSIVMMSDFGTDGRDEVAKFVGVDIAAEWQMDRQYLERKQKPELIELIADTRFNLLGRPEVVDYIYRNLGKTEKTLDMLKKPELIDLILKSGTDLAGIVPDEVMNPV